MQRNKNSIMIFEINRGGGGGGELTGWGKNGPAHSFPGEKSDWGEIPACYTGTRPLDCGATGMVPDP